MIINATRKEVLSSHERRCTNAFSQAWGLMFRSRQNLLMIFPEERKISLHMFFVFYPITVIVLDKQRRIVEMKPDLKPWRTWAAAKKGKYVIEFGFPTKKVQVGDFVELR